ncbi:MAG: nucleotidyltransferase family protein [Candidatus Eisenbacteria bacterium]|nr:nucleotidyltransferase family protein [Candidatus Eisenbacteria bacterium]
MNETAPTAGRDGPLAAVILAAGRSSRMGRMKALLPLSGSTVLGLAIRACRDGGFGPIHVVVGHRAAEVAPAAGAGVKIVENSRYDEGQLTSLQAGIRSLPANVAGALVSPVDHPLVTGRETALLAAAFRGERERRRIFVPFFAGREGRPYLVDRALFPLFLELPAGAPGRRVVWDHPDWVRPVDVESDAVLIDIDTPGDYERVRARLSSPPPPPQTPGALDPS